MAPTDRHDNQFAHLPPIPTYDEAIAGSSTTSTLWQHNDVAHSPIDPEDTHHDHSESHSLLPSSRHVFDSSSSTPNSNPNNPQRPLGRRPRGYRPPTVETDDESNLFSSSSSDDDSDSDDEREAAQVRREMQELEIDDSDVRGSGRSSSWGKRIGRLTSLSLPQWRWRWRLRLPRLRGRTGSGQGEGEGSAGAGAGEQQQQEEGEQTRSRFWRPRGLPEFGSAALLLLIGRMFAILIVLGFLYAVFASDMFAGVSRRMGRQYDPESVRAFIQGQVSSVKIRDHLKHFTSYAHMAGTEGDFALMEDVEMLFRQAGLDQVTRDEYHVYLNYPKAGGRAVEILGEDGKPIWVAKLEEEDAGRKAAGRQTYAFHGLSKSGDVKGPLVYANYGLKGDFEALRGMDIDTKGAIALVRYDGTQRDQALKVKAAEMAGFAGCLIYTDPADNGFMRGKPAPEGPWIPADGVQRGSVGLTNWVVGDVLTPGWGSKEKMPRMKVEQTHGLVNIPSLPLAWRDAQTLLQHLEGKGIRLHDGSSGAGPDIKEWWTGNSSTSPIVHLKNEQDEVEKQPIWNVYGKIVGIEQDDKKIIIGNHRDSFASGAGQPNSGTAVMMEVVRIFGVLLGKGWRPQRTIEFMSWDGGEYNLIGSTEYVEQNDEALRRDALAYINLDAAVTGNTFHAAGSPVFRKLLLQVLNRVADPLKGKSLRDLWDARNGELEALGVGSDYVAFQDIVGASSLDLRFEGEGYPGQSNYDNFEWMQQVGDPGPASDGDPGFYYHALLAEVVGLLILELSDRPVMPFDLSAYVDDLSRWVEELELWIKGQNPQDVAPGQPFTLDQLKYLTKQAPVAVKHFEKWERTWETAVIATNGWEASGLGRQRYEHNSKMAKFESDLLDLDGVSSHLPPRSFLPAPTTFITTNLLTCLKQLPGHTQFKHVIFGPQLWSSGSDDTHFPGIRDAVLSGNWTLAQETVNRVAGIIKQAANNLNEGRS